MTVNTRIISALEDVAPVEPDIYTGDSLDFITFNFDIIPQDFRDNAPLRELYLVQVHYFCPGGAPSLSQRSAIKRRLFARGFTHPREINATDEEGQHFVFECERVERVSQDG